jgi:hypothetical protein
MRAAIRYTGGLPEASETVTLYEASEGVNLCGTEHTWYVLSLRASHAGSVVLSYWNDVDRAWVQFASRPVVGGSTVERMAFSFEPYRRIRVQFVNGGDAQTTFDPQQVLTGPEQEIVDAFGASAGLTAPSGYIEGSARIQNTDSTELIAAPGPGFRNVVWGAAVSNDHATQKSVVNLLSGATVKRTGSAAAVGGGWTVSPGSVPYFRGAENEAINAQCGSSADVYVDVFGTVEPV